MDAPSKPNTLIFLHGLLGAGRTWRQFVLNDQISEDRDIILVDLRNHGESDHHDSMNYTEMADDLLRFLDSRALEHVTLVGHNIGGKTAMRFAGLHSERVKGLISLDTAPVGTAQDKVKMTRSTVE
jgi:esterase